MKLYSMLPEEVTQKIASKTGLTITDDNKGDSIITILIRKNKHGGVTDPTEYITNPSTTIVIPLFPDETGFVFRDKALNAGVPEDNIFFLAEGQGLSVNRIVETIENIKQNILDANNEDVLFFEPLEEQEETKTTKRVRVIAVRGFRGGVGTTTIATSLAVHYAEIGGKIAVVDMGIPANVKFHCKVGEFQEKDDFLMASSNYCDLYKPNKPVWQVDAETISNLVNILRKEYRWVIMDFSPAPDKKLLKAIQPDRTIVVMDSDIFQSVEPAKKTKGALFVYNKAIPDIEPELIKAIVQDEIITIKTDFAGCSAALADETPAYNKSEVITTAIGKLASKIER